MVLQALTGKERLLTPTGAQKPPQSNLPLYFSSAGLIRLQTVFLAVQIQKLVNHLVI